MPEQIFLAHLFLSIKNFKLKNADFYCAPGRHGDHAHEWAAAITSAVGKAFRRPFIKKSIKQKTKTKAEREMINIEISERPIKTKNANKAIFLDDIVATGSTAHNSLSLLEGYVFNEVWCIAYKEHCSD